MPQGGALSGDDVPITEVKADVQTGTDVGAVGLNPVTGDGILPDYFLQTIYLLILNSSSDPTTLG